jgi:hypothetical protein
MNKEVCGLRLYSYPRSQNRDLGHPAIILDLRIETLRDAQGGLWGTSGKDLSLQQYIELFRRDQTL